MLTSENIGHEFAYVKKDGTGVYLVDIISEIRELPKHKGIRGKHIRVQLEAIGRLEEYEQGFTPHFQPFTYLG